MNEMLKDKIDNVIPELKNMIENVPPTPVDGISFAMPSEINESTIEEDETIPKKPTSVSGNSISSESSVF